MSDSKQQTEGLTASEYGTLIYSLILLGVVVTLVFF